MNDTHSETHNLFPHSSPKMDMKSKKLSEKYESYPPTARNRSKSREKQEQEPIKNKSRHATNHNTQPTRRPKETSRHNSSRGQTDADAEIDTALIVLQHLRTDSGSNVEAEDDYPSPTTESHLDNNSSKNAQPSLLQPSDDLPTKQFSIMAPSRIHPMTAPAAPSGTTRNADSFAGDAAGQSEPVSGSVLAEPQETFAGAGSYKFHKEENTDEYLKNLGKNPCYFKVKSLPPGSFTLRNASAGVGLVFRKVQSVANPTLTIYPCRVDEWAIKIDSIFRTREVKFKVGEEFSDETFDGRPCRVRSYRSNTFKCPKNH